MPILKVNTLYISNYDHDKYFSISAWEKPGVSCGTKIVATIRTVLSLQELDPELLTSISTAPETYYTPDFGNYSPNSCEWPPQGLGTFELF